MASVCPHCAEPITADQRVAFRDDRLLHLACWIGTFQQTVRRLIIVAHDRPDLLAEIQRQHARRTDVRVVVDRRHGERRTAERRQGLESDPGRRRAERRRQEIDWMIASQGYAVVRLDEHRTPARILS
ncbi:MAG: hypothetical protein HY294_10275 [Candidatus Rokubacteria bacterium]|nr:hypothetical protein [Candidatus Rokubacteria bacterium]